MLSAPSDDDHWNGRTGWVHEAVLADYTNLNNFEVYMSGPPPMIQAAKLSFLERGLAENNLYFDSFDFAPDNLMRG